MARTEGGINNLNSDDPVLNRQMFASFANGGEVESTQTVNQEKPIAEGEITKEEFERIKKDI